MSLLIIQKAFVENQLDYFAYKNAYVDAKWPRKSTFLV